MTQQAYLLCNNSGESFLCLHKQCKEAVYALDDPYSCTQDYWLVLVASAGLKAGSVLGTTIGAQHDGLCCY